MNDSTASVHLTGDFGTILTMDLQNRMTPVYCRVVAYLNKRKIIWNDGKLYSLSG
jgi:hypothetical protein